MVMETWRHRHGAMDMETWTRRQGDMDMETWTRRHRHGDLDMETWTWRVGHGDMAWRHGHGIEILGNSDDLRKKSNEKPRRFSLSHLPFAHRATRSMSFVRLVMKKQMEVIHLLTD